METDQIMSAIFLIAVLILILPGFLSTNSRMKQFFSNLSIWTIIVLTIILLLFARVDKPVTLHDDTIVTYDAMLIDEQKPAD